MSRDGWMEKVGGIAFLQEGPLAVVIGRRGLGSWIGWAVVVQCRSGLERWKSSVCQGFDVGSLVDNLTALDVEGLVGFNKETRRELSSSIWHVECGEVKMEMEMGIKGGYIEPSPGVSNPSIQLPSSRSLAELMGLPGG